MHLRNARLGPDEEPRDVFIAEGRIAAATPQTSEEIDLDGRFVIPGLWDHHVHFDQWTMVRRRIDLAPATSVAHAVRLLEAALPTWTDDVITGYGYRDALWPQPPTAADLDAVTGDRPAMLASGDLHSAWLNSSALARFGFDTHPTGKLLEQDAMTIFAAVTDVPQAQRDRWADDAARAAAARGVVGVVDLEAPFALTSWQRRIAAGTRSLRVRVGVWTSALDTAITAGLRTGAVVADTDGLLEMGPFKVITDGSLNSRTAYCHDPYPGTSDRGLLLVAAKELEALMARAQANGLDCAVHAIGDHANSLALAAFAATGARGSIEHAQLLDATDIPRFADLGVTASVQPEHALDDRDVADELWAGRTQRAFLLRALLDAGVRITLGSDAPVAPLDPWVTMAAAVSRTRDGRPAWHPEQEITLSEALAASTRHGPRVEVGAPADLVVLDGDPYRSTAAELRTLSVAATILGGQATHGLGS